VSRLQVCADNNKGVLLFFNMFRCILRVNAPQSCVFSLLKTPPICCTSYRLYSSGKELQTELTHVHKLFAKNLPYKTTEDDLCTLFPKSTAIDMGRYPDGGSKGFAYIDFASSEEAHDALENKQGAFLLGKVISLNLDTEHLKERPKLNIEIESTDFRSRSDIRSGLPKGYVCFNCGGSGHHIQDCHHERRGLDRRQRKMYDVEDGQEDGHVGMKVYDDYQEDLVEPLPAPTERPPGKILIIKNLHIKTSTTALWQYFRSADYIDIPKHDETDEHMGIGYVTFRCIEDAEMVMYTMKGEVVDGNIIYLDYVGTDWHKARDAEEAIQEGKTRTIVISNLKRESTETEIRRAFPTSSQVTVMHNQEALCNGTAYVEFDSVLLAREAFEHRYRNPVIRGRQVILELHGAEVRPSEVRPIKGRGNVCSNCKLPGHVVWNCPHPWQSNKSKVMCGNCGKSGHFSNSCKNPPSKQILGPVIKEKKEYVKSKYCMI